MRADLTNPFQPLKPSRTRPKWNFLNEQLQQLGVKDVSCARCGPEVWPASVCLTQRYIIVYCCCSLSNQIEQIAGICVDERCHSAAAGVCLNHAHKHRARPVHGFCFLLWHCSSTHLSRSHLNSPEASPQKRCRPQKLPTCCRFSVFRHTWFTSDSCVCRASMFGLRCCRSSTFVWLRITQLMQILRRLYPIVL